MKKISSYLINLIAPSAGFSEGRIKDDPGDGSGSGATVQTGNDWLYAIYAPILKYMGALSDADESESASDMLNALERIAEHLGASEHIPSYDYFVDNYILRDGVIWKTNANIDTGVDGVDFISQYNAGKWVSQVFDTDRDYVFGGDIKINTSDIAYDVDFAEGECFDRISGDKINLLPLTKQMDNLFSPGDNQGMLDIGSVAANKAYLLFAIKKDSDFTGDYLASLSPTAPSMPVGYTMNRHIGTVITNELTNQIKTVSPSVGRTYRAIFRSANVVIRADEISHNSDSDKYLSTGKANKTNLSENKRYEAEAGLATSQITWTVLSNGLITGNLPFNTTSVPPKISSGTRDAFGKDIQEIADIALGLGDAFGVCSQVFADYTYSWMKILINDQGEYKYIPSFDSYPVASLTDIAVSAVSVAANVATVATGNTTGLGIGQVVIVKDSDVGELIGKVTGITAGVSFTMKTSKANGAYSSGTYSAKYRIATLHGVGTIAGINTDAEIEKYSPSPEFNKNYNGYCRDIDGDIDITGGAVWRDIGAFFIDSAGNVTHVISYKSGQNKNDNYANSGSGDGVKVGSFYRWNGVWRYLWGNDYTITDDGTDAGRLTYNRAIAKTNCDVVHHTAPSGNFGFSIVRSGIAEPSSNNTRADASFRSMNATIKDANAGDYIYISGTSGSIPFQSLNFSMEL